MAKLKGSRGHNSSVSHHGVGEKIQGNCNVPTVDILKEGKLICHAKYPIDFTHTAAAVKRVIYPIKIAKQFISLILR